MKQLLFLLFIMFFLTIGMVYASSKDDITFPVAELGGCEDEEECRAFCDIPENKMSPCFPFAKEHNLVTQEELDRAARFTQLATTGGPGWCRTDEGCSIEVFCNDYANLDQCLDFAEENGFATPDELQKARQVAAGMKKEDAIPPPGNCRGENECGIYCSLEGNWQECLTWQEQIGIPLELSPEAQRFVDLIRSGKSAGGCDSKTACEAYCADPEHSEECLDMALAVGFITEEEAELARQYGSTGPGGCKTEQECQAFCSQPYNQRVCLSYANDQEVEVDFQGPGGCSDIASCTAYCTQNSSDPECEEYSSKYEGFKGPGGCEDESSCTAYCQTNPSDAECKQYSGQYGGFSGPGGCSDVGSCTAYCKEHSQDSECQKYSSQYGGFSGPGGCNSIESCTSYCKSNPKDSACAQYVGSAGQYGGFSGPGGCTDEASCTSYCKSNPKDSACTPYVGQYGGRVQGVNTTRSFFQLILDTLFRR